MSGISTHVLDLARGCPGQGIPVVLERSAGGGFRQVGSGETDADGRVGRLLAEGETLQPGVYRLTFELAGYSRQGGFFPRAAIEFKVQSASENYHVPLLLSPYGYSTYRGS